MERAQKQAEAKVDKERIVVEAEKLASGTDWRNGANRLRELLDRWKALPAHRPSLRRCPVAAVLVGADDVHQGAQVALRRAAREA